MMYVYVASNDVTSVKRFVEYYQKLKWEAQREHHDLISLFFVSKVGQ
jgi:hypothetical protein